MILVNYTYRSELVNEVVNGAFRAAGVFAAHGAAKRAAEPFLVRSGAEGGLLSSARVCPGRDGRMAQGGSRSSDGAGFMKERSGTRHRRSGEKGLG